MLPTIKKTNWLPNIFSDFFGNEWIDRMHFTNPAVNILENDKQYVVELAAPGLTREDFKIELGDENHLVVSVQKKAESKEEDKDTKYIRREFSQMNFRQSLFLPDNTDKDNIQAKMENGVMRIEIPKKVTAEKPVVTRKIEIQ